MCRLPISKKEEAFCLGRKSDENHPTVHNVAQEGQETRGYLKDVLKKRRTSSKCVLMNLSNNRNIVMLKEKGGVSNPFEKWQ